MLSNSWHACEALAVHTCIAVVTCGSGASAISPRALAVENSVARLTSLPKQTPSSFKRSISCSLLTGESLLAPGNRSKGAIVQVLSVCQARQDWMSMLSRIGGPMPRLPGSSFSEHRAREQQSGKQLLQVGFARPTLCHHLITVRWQIQSNLATRGCMPASCKLFLVRVLHHWSEYYPHILFAHPSGLTLSLPRRQQDTVSL